MNYSKALEFIREASFKGSVLGLSRIRQLLELMGNPQRECRFIHVSGTNGKGSFTAMMTAILKSAGYKTGSFSSPHLIRVNESFRINCNELSDEKFAEIIEYIAPFTEKMDDKPTEFEILTAGAFELFKREKCDVAVVECGMGGDTDSTNVIENPVLSVITNVEKDHCGFLGDSIEEIAHHKAGIIKKYSPVIFGGENAAAESVIKNAAQKLESHYYHSDKAKIYNVDFRSTETVFSYGKLENIRLSLLGLYQTDNAVNVLEAVEILKGNGFDITDNSIYEGMKNCRWCGRFEIIQKNPLVIFDGSHNPQGMEYTVKSIKHYFKDLKPTILIGVMSDKDYHIYGKMLKECVGHVFTVKPDNPRALDADKLAEVFSENDIPVSSYSVLKDGVKTAYEYSMENNVPLIALGSLYMYREFTDVLEKCK